MLLYPVGKVEATVLNATNATLAASNGVATKLKTGRHGIAITAGENDIYLGDKNVAVGKGMAIKAGTTTILPVLTTCIDEIYVIGGSCVLTEFFG